MVSILNNEGAAVALNTLREINRNLGQVQQEISTGKSVANAKDNAAIFAVSSVIEADVESFRAISNSLNLGNSTIGVARTAAEEVTNLLTEIQSNVVAAQEDNVDRGLIQNEISNLRDQINSIVNAAQFNGLNLLEGNEAVSILSSLDRQADQSVVASSISISRTDLTTATGTRGVEAAASTIVAAGASVTAFDGGIAADQNQQDVTVGSLTTGQTTSIDIGGIVVTFTDGGSGSTATEARDGLQAAIQSQINAGFINDVVVTTSGATDITISNTSATASLTTADGGGDVAVTGVGAVDNASETLELTARTTTEGDSYRVTLNGTNIDYVAQAGQNVNQVASGLQNAINAQTANNPNFTDLEVSVVQSANVNSDSAFITIGLGVNATTGEANVSTQSFTFTTGGVGTGGLGALSTIDVSSSSGASDALAAIDDLIAVGVQAAANFGSAQSRIEIQEEFVTNLIDSLNSGISALTDADLEEASARLQSLQVQQQLGIQALSIANQQPQALLSLFR